MLASVSDAEMTFLSAGNFVELSIPVRTSCHNVSVSFMLALMRSVGLEIGSDGTT